MEPLIELHILVPIENRPGVFAVLPTYEATRIKQGYMKLYWRNGRVVRETITQSRYKFDYEPPLVFVAVDPNGSIVTEVVP